jgi:hypothetical protein
MSQISHTVVPPTKIDACCDPVGGRYGGALRCVEIIPSAEDGTVYCTATNGSVLSIVLAPGMAKGPALLPGKFAKPGKPAMLNGRWESNGKFIEPGDPGFRFPKCQDVITSLTDDDAPQFTVLCLNAGYLKQLADAIGDEDSVVTMFIPPNGDEQNVDKAVAVRGVNGIGVIMPVTIGRAQNVIEYRDRFEEIRRAYTFARNAAHQPVDEPVIESEPVAAAA